MIFNNSEYTYLKSLLCACAPSSHEFAATEIFREKISFLTDKLIKDNLGNTIAISNTKGGLNVMISAHIDEIGFQVTNICEDSLLKIRAIGGVNPYTMNGHKVTILSDNGPINGILVYKSNNNNYAPDINAFYIDINASSYEYTKKYTQIGNVVTFAPNYELSNDIITSKAIDDRIGIFSISQIFENLSGKLKNIKLIAAATAQEEIGLRGMALVAQEIMPDICINIDVTDAVQINKNDGLPQVGKGVVICNNADTNPILRKTLYDIALKKKIPTQTVVGRNITGGTDSSRIQIFSHKTATADLSIPCKYIHTNHECCSLHDVSYCIELCSSFINELDKNIAKYNKNTFAY